MSALNFSPSGRLSAGVAEHAATLILTAERYCTWQGITAGDDRQPCDRIAVSVGIVGGDVMSCVGAWCIEHTGRMASTGALAVRSGSDIQVILASLEVADPEVRAQVRSILGERSQS